MCIGNEWCAVATDALLIRVISFLGIEIACLSFEKPIVCLVGMKINSVY